MKSFRDLRVWQTAHGLVLLTYKATKTFPKEELFGITSQMRRAAVSITSNIAEGFARSTSKDREHFYVMALGSLSELESQYQISIDLTYMDEEAWQQADEQILVCTKQLKALLKAHRAKQ
ncbi:MAG: four helix bundle protein [Candidatus Saccharibacteria bacterium]|nr:four helix bundle protein [Candidatus Saccharibacteria bacterium]